jgi:hypothetical protein
MSATRRSRSRGAALVVTTLFTASVSALALLTLSSSTSSYATMKSRLESIKSFYIAEGGMDWFLGQLTTNTWFPARSATSFPTLAADGSFQSDWRTLGANGGQFQVTVSYVVANKVPSTWTGAGYPPGFQPVSTVTFASRSTSKPSFDRINVVVAGRYAGSTRFARASIKYQRSTAARSSPTRLPSRVPGAARASRSATTS